MRLREEGETVKTIKWLMREYRHEDVEGRYYLDSIIHIWLSGTKTGFILGLLPFIIWWILR